MAKNKNKVEIKGSIVATITNNLNKRGEIKGNTKKETKNLKAMCTHHKINKKGKIKPAIYNDGNGVCVCELCGHKFDAHIYDKGELNKIVNKFTNVLDQSKYMAQASDLGKDTIEYLGELSVGVSHFSKTYNKISNVVRRADNIKNKKKKNKFGGDDGSTSYGGWR